MAGTAHVPPMTRPATIQADIDVELPEHWHAVMDGKLVKALFVVMDDANDYIHKQEREGIPPGRQHLMKVRL